MFTALGDSIADALVFLLPMQRLQFSHLTLLPKRTKKKRSRRVTSRAKRKKVSYKRETPKSREEREVPSPASAGKQPYIGMMLFKFWIRRVLLDQS